MISWLCEEWSLFIHDAKRIAPAKKKMMFFIRRNLKSDFDALKIAT
jgi:hypothetical protein